MVGRELPNVRPNGEDHRGERGTTWLLATGRICGVMARGWWRSWGLVMILIHKELVLLRGDVFQATRFVLRE